MKLLSATLFLAAFRPARSPRRPTLLGANTGKRKLVLLWRDKATRRRMKGTP